MRKGASVGVSHHPPSSPSPTAARSPTTVFLSSPPPPRCLVKQLKKQCAYVCVYTFSSFPSHLPLPLSVGSLLPIRPPLHSLRALPVCSYGIGGCVLRGKDTVPRPPRPQTKSPREGPREHTAGQARKLPDVTSRRRQGENEVATNKRSSSPSPPPSASAAPSTKRERERESGRTYGVEDRLSCYYTPVTSYPFE